MSSDDNDSDWGLTSPRSLQAPDLEILGDKVTLHPRGYVPSAAGKRGDKEKALMEHSGRFRKSPLEYVLSDETATID